LVDFSSAPSALEQVLGRLVEAGITDAQDLAPALGLQSHHVGRPLRKLTLAGVLEPEPSGKLRVTPRGRAWLGIVPTPTTPEPAVVPQRSAEPRLLPPQIAAEMDRTAVAADVGRVPPAAVHRADGWTRLGIAVARIRETLGRVRMPMPTVRLAVPIVGWRWPNVQVTVDGVDLSASMARRIAAATASVVVVMIVVRLAVPGWSSTSVEVPLGVGALHDDARPLTDEAVATPRPAATSTPSDRWVTVNHTNGLGLVLRPAPASTARNLTLAEGARLRVTGEPVQQAGRVWLPVVSQSGKTGWVASEFVAPDP
jgi:hypothetical protein